MNGKRSNELESRNLKDISKINLHVALISIEFVGS
jgi:hypothetical protein